MKQLSIDPPSVLDVPDTPRLIRRTISGPETRLDILRQETIEDIWAIPEVSFDFYKDAVLPKVEVAALNTACDALRNAGDWKDDGWCSMRFEGDNSKKTENDFYAPLAKSLQKKVDHNGSIRFSSKPDST